MYVDAGVGDSNPITISVITSGSPFPRLWRIRISQIECTSISRADPGCLQYYTGVYGRLKSFNFDANVGSQLSNQDYSICIRTERNFCSIQYTACPDTSIYLLFYFLWSSIANYFHCILTFYFRNDADSNRSRSFTLSGNSNQPVNAMVGGGTQGMPNSCGSDWLLIGCARVADRLPQSNACEDRICGGTFNAEVSSMEKTVKSEHIFHLI